MPDTREGPWTPAEVDAELITLEFDMDVDPGDVELERQFVHGTMHFRVIAWDDPDSGWLYVLSPGHYRYRHDDGTAYLIDADDSQAAAEAAIKLWYAEQGDDNE
jgi:hypothetical protein